MRSCQSALERRERNSDPSSVSHPLSSWNKGCTRRVVEVGLSAQAQSKKPQGFLNGEFPGVASQGLRDRRAKRIARPVETTSPTSPAKIRKCECSACPKAPANNPTSVRRQIAARARAINKRPCAGSGAKVSADFPLTIRTSATSGGRERAVAKTQSHTAEPTSPATSSATAHTQNATAGRKRAPSRQPLTVAPEDQCCLAAWRRRPRSQPVRTTASPR